MSFLKYDPRPYLFWVVTLVFAGTFLVTDYTFADAAGMFVILAAFLVKSVIDWKYPERPDVFGRISDLTAQVKLLTEKVESSESDLTALKIGNGMR